MNLAKKTSRLGMEAQQHNQRESFRLAKRFGNATDLAEAKRLGDKLGPRIFGG